MLDAIQSQKRYCRHSLTPPSHPAQRNSGARRGPRFANSTRERGTRLMGVTCKHRNGKRLGHPSLCITLIVLTGAIHAAADTDNSVKCHRWLNKVSQSPKNVQAKQSRAQSGSRTPIVAPPSDPWGVASLSE